MFCPRCGYEVANDARFCTECGFDLSGVRNRWDLSSHDGVAPAPVASDASGQPASPAPKQHDSASTSQAPAELPVSQVPDGPAIGSESHPYAYQQEWAQDQSFGYQPPTGNPSARPSQPYSGAGTGPAQPGVASWPSASPATTPYPGTASPRPSQPFYRAGWFKVVVGIVAVSVVVAVVLFLSNWIGRTSRGGGAATDVETADAYGNPTFDAVMALSGEDLADDLESRGWEYEDDFEMWISNDGNDAYYVMGVDDYEYSEREMRSLGVYGGDEACCFTFVIDADSYDTARDAVEGLAADAEIEDDAWYVDSFGAAEVTYEGKSGIVMAVFDTDNDLYLITLFNEEAVSQGIVEEYIGRDGGTTIDESWEVVKEYMTE